MNHSKNNTFDSYIAKAKGYAPVTTAVVHPLSEEALMGAIEAAQMGLITPLLVGPVKRMTQLATTMKVDISRYQVVDTEHSNASAARAVALARSGEVKMLMKGSLHSDELLHEVLKDELGLKTSRYLSHVFVLSVPTYPKLLLLSDAAINIEPNLDVKRDIVQNVIDFAHALAIDNPKVAILAAVETVSMKMPATLDAAALCKMTERGQIKGGVLDGPLAFDNIVSEDAAKIKNINSAVAGDADVIIAPNLETGNMLAKQFEYLGKSQIAGVVLGARVPIVLTSRADGDKSRLASCAFAILYGNYLQSLAKKKHV